MNVWLLHIGEELPVDGPARAFRYGYLADALDAAGHRVLRWAPTFRHTTRQHRYAADCRVAITPNYAIQFVHAPGYPRNTSLRRLRTYRVLARRFRELAGREPRPDVMIAAIPSLEWACAAVEVGRRLGVPALVDVRDLWPDVFPSALPAWAQPAGRLLMAPYRRLARRACRAATGLIAVSDAYLQWGLRHAGRRRGPHDGVVPLGYEPPPCPARAVEQAHAELRRRGVDPARPACFFAGGLNRHHDVETIIDAARILRQSNPETHGAVQVVICGTGAKAAALAARARDLPGVHLLGWADAAMLQAAASMSQIGLCAYGPGALMSLGNKPYEYMARRLAIASSLPGELAELLARHDCGVTYQAGDAAALARCLQQLLNNPQRLQQMRANAHRAWSQQFQASAIYSQFVERLARFPPPQSRAA
jgi:glycosyltransferase involved in cell wall biosynthesis